MMFLLHLPPETRALDRSPLLNKETCEFLFQAVWHCSNEAVLLACGYRVKTSDEVFDKSFGNATAYWIAERKKRAGQSEGVKK